MQYKILRYSKKTKFGKIVIFSFLILISVITATFLIGKTWIKLEANSLAKEASENFHKDKVESLLVLIDSDNYSLKEKNNAIWALGVLQDERALPKLEVLYTGEECNHEKALCKYEIKKAILKINSDFKGSWQAPSR